MMLLKRSYEKEIMDDFSINNEHVDVAFDEIKLVNKFLGGISTSKDGFRLLLNNNISKVQKVLDIGSGASDIFESLHKNYPNLRVYSLDRNKRACDIIRNKKGITLPILGDVLNAPVKPNCISVVHASLLFHHFTKEELKNIISDYMMIATDGIIINDLRRSVWALLGIRVLLFLFSKSSLVKNDAPLSVRRGFIKSELIDILKDLNLTNYKIKRKWAFRWLVVIRKAHR